MEFLRLVSVGCDFYTYFLHFLSPVLILFSSRPMKLHMLITFFLIYTTYFIVMLFFLIFLDIAIQYSLLWLIGVSVREVFWTLFYFSGVACWDEVMEWTCRIDQFQSMVEQIVVTPCMFLQVAVTHCMLLQAAVTPHDDTDDHCYTKDVSTQWLLLHLALSFDFGMLFHCSWQSSGYYSTQKLSGVMNCYLEATDPSGCDLNQCISEAFVFRNRL